MDTDSGSIDGGRWTSYWDSGGLVIVDVTNPNAWIRSDMTFELAGPDPEVRSDTAGHP